MLVQYIDNSHTDMKRYMYVLLIMTGSFPAVGCTHCTSFLTWLFVIKQSI